MPGPIALTALAALLGLAAILYQNSLPRAIALGLGIGHTASPLSHFPGFACRRLVHPRLQACEDMWLSEPTRQLFLACSHSLGRKEWLPSVGAFNASGRSRVDAVVVLSIDEPVDAPEGFALRVLDTPGFTGGINGSAELHLTGFSAVEDGDGSIRFWLINSKPSVDPATGELLDNYKTGANATVELFRLGDPASGSSSLEHVRTFSDPEIATPNRVAAVGGEGDDGFYLTNDHGSHKAGLLFHLSPYLSTGTISYCPGTGTSPCRFAATGIAYPNGLVVVHPRLNNNSNSISPSHLYVPSSQHGTITRYAIQPDASLRQAGEPLDVGYSLDNLSVDRHGTMYAAAFHAGMEVVNAFKDPTQRRPPPGLALRIGRVEEWGEEVGKKGWKVEKMVEDGGREVLPTTMTTVFDAKTGRLFLSSCFSPWIAVCEPV